MQLTVEFELQTRHVSKLTFALQLLPMQVLQNCPSRRHSVTSYARRLLRHPLLIIPPKYKNMLQVYERKTNEKSYEIVHYSGWVEKIITVNFQMSIYVFVFSKRPHEYFLEQLFILRLLHYL